MIILSLSTPPSVRTVSPVVGHEAPRGGGSVRRERGWVRYVAAARGFQGWNLFEAAIRETAMRNPCAAVVAVASVAWLAAGAGAGEGLVPNGGFEEPAGADPREQIARDIRKLYGGAKPTPFAGWFFGGGWENGRYTVHASSEAHSGKRSCEIRCRKKGRGGIASMPFKLRPGTIVKVEFWLKARDAEGGQVLLNFEGTPGDGWNRLRIPGGTYDWRKVTRRCVVPVRHSRADGQTLLIFIYSKTGGSIWIDDVSVTTVDVNELAESPGPPALTAPRPKAVPEPAGSVGYRVDVADGLTKVLSNTDFAAETAGRASLALCRNEAEAVQVIVEAPWRDVKVEAVDLSPLTGPDGATIPASAMTWRRVDDVETTVSPPYPVRRVGLWPDPLMPPGPFTVEAPSRRAVWVELKAPADAAPGRYRGTITVRPAGLEPTAVPLDVTVWDLAIPDKTHLRTLTWLGTGVIRAFYGLKWSPENQRRFERILRDYQDMLLDHRLGPGGAVANRVHKNRKTGTYDFSQVDQRLQRLIGRGMNAFIMGTAPNLKRKGKKRYTPEFIAQFTDMLKAYGDHLREKGWIDKAYVYTYDEAPRSAWPEVRKIAKAIRAAAPELRILQCLNQPAGVKALEDAIDVFDVYVAQYHRTGVANLQKRGTEVWLAVCCYPMERPNLFIEYPLIDGRLLAVYCWKYNAAGFEYWSPNSWGTNWRAKPPNQWPDAPWNPNTFGRYNGDGYLLYPGPDGKPYPSIRLKAFRDGVEDYELLRLLAGLTDRARKAGNAPANLLAAAKAVLDTEGVLADSGTILADAEAYKAFRRRAAETALKLKALVGESE